MVGKYSTSKNFQFFFPSIFCFLRSNQFSSQPDGKSLKSYLPNDFEELKRRVDRYKKNHKQLIKLSVRLGISVVLAIQPEITSRGVDKLSAGEKAIRNHLGKDYLKNFPQAYGELVKTSKNLAKNFPENVEVINF